MIVQERAAELGREFPAPLAATDDGAEIVGRFERGFATLDHAKHVREHLSRTERLANDDVDAQHAAVAVGYLDVAISLLERNTVNVSHLATDECDAVLRKVRGVWPVSTQKPRICDALESQLMTANNGARTAESSRQQAA